GAVLRRRAAPPAPLIVRTRRALPSHRLTAPWARIRSLLTVPDILISTRPTAVLLVAASFEHRGTADALRPPRRLALRGATCLAPDPRTACPPRASEMRTTVDAREIHENLPRKTSKRQKSSTGNVTL